MVPDEMENNYFTFANNFHFLQVIPTKPTGMSENC